MQHGFHLPQFQSKQERETNLSKILPSWYAAFTKSIKQPNNFIYQNHFMNVSLFELCIYFTFQALESIPQIPIHVTEIKKLIIKDNLNAKSITSDNDVDESRLLSVLTHGSTGRNPTFFKAYGHNDVFGLRVDIPEGCTTLEITENIPNEDPGGMDEPRQGETENQNVLYVQLPDGHPVITGTDQVSSQVSLASSYHKEHL